MAAAVLVVVVVVVVVVAAVVGVKERIIIVAAGLQPMAVQSQAACRSDSVKERREDFIET